MEQAKLNRLEKYSKWLADDRHYDPAAYNLVNELLLTKSVPDYAKEKLNKIELAYQNDKIKRDAERVSIKELLNIDNKTK